MSKIIENKLVPNEIHAIACIENGAKAPIEIGTLVPTGGREFMPVRCNYSATSDNCVVEQEDSKLYTSCIKESYKGCIDNSKLELCI